MISFLETFVFVVFAYLLGSLSSAIIICKLMRLPDPRTEGSHNPGATNVLRIGGRIPALLTLLGDALKGFIPVLIAIWYGLTPFGIALTGLAAFIGHLYPIFFRFEGGKGVATFIGVLFALSWQAALCWCATWFIIAGIWRYASIASITASLLAVIYVWYFTDNSTITFITLIMSIIIVISHQSNIAKLRAGTENKIGEKSPL